MTERSAAMLGFFMPAGPGEAEMAIALLWHALQLYPGTHACVRYEGMPDANLLSGCKICAHSIPAAFFRLKSAWRPVRSAARAD